MHFKPTARWMSLLLFQVAGLLFLGVGARVSAADQDGQEATKAVKQVLHAFHRAASKADLDSYFAQTDKSLVFLGTDASERFLQADLKAYAKPYFSKGKGWTYVPAKQHVRLSPDMKLAWFDEQLRNEKYGTMRGSGVLIRRSEGWRIVQYNLTFQVPNKLVPDLTKKIAAATQQPPADTVKFPPRPAQEAADAKTAVKEMLIDYQRSASKAEGERFFGYLAKDAVVYGTDVSERWSVDDLRKLAGPLFAQGQGWTSIPANPHVFLDSSGKMAWFDEKLISSKWGELRATGVLQKRDRRWKIVHYNMAFPIPNELAQDVVQQIKEASND